MALPVPSAARAVWSMNVAFFLTPKRYVVWLPNDATMRQAFDRMESTGYSALPVLDAAGHYTCTVTEGDLLRKLVGSERGMSIEQMSLVPLDEVPVRKHVRATSIEVEIEHLLERAIEQNFVPVVDSRRAFIGIVRRREILEHFAQAVPKRRDDR
jgi:CBS-domain-containing membrane protein